MKRFLTLGIVSLLMINGLKGQELKEGYNVIYFPGGKVSSEGTIKDGEPEGYWKTYFPNGILKSEGNRKNHLLDSLWIFYNESGDTLQKVSYLMGLRNGYTTVYNTTYDKNPLNRGNVISRELYVNDKKEGWSLYYYSDGALKEEVFYVNNKRSGIAKEYDESGLLITLRTYNNGVLIDRENINRTDEKGFKQGIWREYYADGKTRSESYYKNGNLDGQYREFDSDGNISVMIRYNDGLIVEDIDTEDIEIEFENRYDENGNIVFSGTFRDSVPVGIHRYFNAEGKVTSSKMFDENGSVIAEGVINPDGSREGKWVYFYDNGKVRSTGNFVNNREEGKWSYFSANGNTSQEGLFRGGRYDDLWTWFYDNGSVKREEEYYNGVEEGMYTEYDTAGIVINKGTYFDGLREGEWYYNVGDYNEKGVYKSGEKDGKWAAYYPDGTLKYEGSYILGNPDGYHRFYYPNGMLKEENYYNMGIREKNWKKFDQYGNLLITITFRNNEEYRINGERIDFPAGSIDISQQP